MSTLPRLGFLGIGWIGRQRMQAVHDSGGARVAAVADADPALAHAAAECRRIVDMARRAISTAIRR